MIGQWGRMLVFMIWIEKRGENTGQSWRAVVEPLEGGGKAMLQMQFLWTQAEGL